MHCSLHEWRSDRTSPLVNRVTERGRAIPLRKCPERRKDDVCSAKLVPIVRKHIEVKQVLVHEVSSDVDPWRQTTDTLAHRLRTRIPHAPQGAERPASLGGAWFSLNWCPLTATVPRATRDRCTVAMTPIAKPGATRLRRVSSRAVEHTRIRPVGNCPRLHRPEFGPRALSGADSSAPRQRTRVGPPQCRSNPDRQRDVGRAQPASNRRPSRFPWPAANHCRGAAPPRTWSDSGHATKPPRRSRPSFACRSSGPQRRSSPLRRTRPPAQSCGSAKPSWHQPPLHLKLWKQRSPSPTPFPGSRSPSVASPWRQVLRPSGPRLPATVPPRPNR